jgi:hypothetical protein
MVPCADDKHMPAGQVSGVFDPPVGDGSRLDHGTRVKGNIVGKAIQEMFRDCDILGHGTVAVHGAVETLVPA